MNKGSKVCKMLIIWRKKVISYAFIQKVPNVEDEMLNFEERLRKMRIQQRRRPEKKWLAELLVNKRAVGLLLGYLKDIKMGSREKTVQRIMEQRRKSNWEREKLLGNS